MTAHAHEPSPHPSGHGGPGPAASRPAARRSRPRWLLPVVAAAAVAAMLVALDVISLSTVLYGGLLGSMVLMHVGGHGGGHGGHGGHGRPVDGGPHRGLEVGTADAADDPSGRSPGSETDDAASQTGSDPRATTVPEGNEKHDHDQHSSHACH